MTTEKYNPYLPLFDSDFNTMEKIKQLCETDNIEKFKEEYEKEGERGFWIVYFAIIKYNLFDYVCLHDKINIAMFIANKYGEFKLTVNEGKILSYSITSEHIDDLPEYSFTKYTVQIENNVCKCSGSIICNGTRSENFIDYWGIEKEKVWEGMNKKTPIRYASNGSTFVNLLTCEEVKVTRHLNYDHVIDDLYESYIDRLRNE